MYSNFVPDYCKRKFCCRKQYRLNQFYLKAIEKLENDFEIVNLFKSIKQSSSKLKIKETAITEVIELSISDDNEDMSYL